MSAIRSTLPAFEFEKPTDRDAYRVFPAALENDSSVYFHGTSETFLDSIIAEGFKTPPSKVRPSFAAQSGLALGYACSKRGSDCGCVIAVRFPNVEHSSLEHFMGGLHYSPSMGPQPEIIGFVIVPQSYVHV